MRSMLLRKYLVSYCHSFSEKYPARLQIKGADFDGISSIAIEELSLVPNSGDTLAAIHHFQVTVSLSSLLRFKINVNDLKAEKVYLNLVNDSLSNNYSFLLKRKNGNDTVQSPEGWGIRIHSAIEKLFATPLQNLTISSLLIRYRREKRNITLHATGMEFRNDTFGMRMNIGDAGYDNPVLLMGVLDRKNEHFWIKLVSEKRSAQLVSYSENSILPEVRFDTVFVSLSKANLQDTLLSLEGSFRFNNLELFHPKLSPDPIFIDKEIFEMHASIGNTGLTLDSSSTLTIGNLVMHPFISFSNRPGRYSQLRVRTEPTDASQFFASLPKGLFHFANTIQGSGTLTYTLNFSGNIDAPDSVQFESTLARKDLKLNAESLYPITRINAPFEYTAFEKGQAVKTFTVGPENPNFCPLSRISELLKNCVLTSEDGSFFYHKGFNEEMFAKAIADDLRQRRFARGGSTITMQMVKNVFLTRKKTIGRKLEEALIVWLIEQNKLLSKERILEVYLNVIEWGPGVYGITDASRFYFSKRPADLSLEECIFLASIVPSPKLFRYSFDSSGNLKGSLGSFYKVISGILLKKMVLTDMEYEQLKPSVRITGQARQFIFPPDSILNDLSIQEPLE